MAVSTDAAREAVRKIGVVNGLRGFAILAVLWHHLFSGLTRPGWHAVRVGGLELYPFAPLSNGGLGVGVFFVLSGFVLHLPYASGARTMATWSDAAAFYRARAARLLPLYFLNVTVALLFATKPDVRDPAFGREVFLLATGLFHFDAAQFEPTCNWVLWSLGVEIWFSVLFPPLLVAVRRFGVRRVLAGALVLGWIVRGFGVGGAGGPQVDPVRDDIGGRLDDFVVGMLVCEAYLAGRSPGGRPWAGAALGAAALFGACHLWDAMYLGTAPAWGRIVVNNLLQVGTAALMLGLLRAPPGGLRRLFTNRFVQVVGMMCYSIYVWHGIAIAPVIRHQTTVAALCWYAALLAGLSALTYRFVEFGKERDARRLFRGVPD